MGSYNSLTAYTSGYDDDDDADNADGNNNNNDNNDNDNKFLYTVLMLATARIADKHGSFNRTSTGWSKNLAQFFVCLNFVKYNRFTKLFH